jgi:hypothetical protein
MVRRNQPGDPASHDGNCWLVRFPRHRSLL